MGDSFGENGSCYELIDLGFLTELIFGVFVNTCP